jgi:quercetin dioxygenase-like cupin family protein
MASTAFPGEPIRLGGITIHFFVDPEASAGSVSMFRCDVRAGAGVPVPHSHDAFDETVYGLTGVAAFTVDGAARDVAPGDVLFIPRGAVHGFAVDDEDASFLAVATPGIFGPAYFTEIGEVIRAAAGGPPDREAMMGVMRRHGLTPAPPAG